MRSLLILMGIVAIVFGCFQLTQLWQMNTRAQTAGCDITNLSGYENGSCGQYGSQATRLMGTAIVTGLLGLALISISGYRRKKTETISNNSFASSGGLESKLRELDSMKTRGLINESEYQKARNKLFSD